MGMGGRIGGQGGYEQPQYGGGYPAGPGKGRAPFGQPPAQQQPPYGGGFGGYQQPQFGGGFGGYQQPQFGGGYPSGPGKGRAPMAQPPMAQPPMAQPPDNRREDSRRRGFPAPLPAWTGKTDLEEARIRWEQQGEAEGISDDEWRQAGGRNVKSKLQSMEMSRPGDPVPTLRDRSIDSLFSDLAREKSQREDQEYRNLPGSPRDKMAFLRAREDLNKAQAGAIVAPQPLAPQPGAELDVTQQLMRPVHDSLSERMRDQIRPATPRPSPLRPVAPPQIMQPMPFSSYGSPGKGMRPQPHGGGFGRGFGRGFGGGFGGYQPSPYMPPSPYGGSFGGGFNQGYGVPRGIGSLLSSYPSYMPPRMHFNPYVR